VVSRAKRVRECAEGCPGTSKYRSQSDRLEKGLGEGPEFIGKTHDEIRGCGLRLLGGAEVILVGSMDNKLHF